jgi:hypothetical protein
MESIIEDWHLISGIVTTLIGLGVIWGKTTSKLKLIKSEVDTLEALLKTLSIKTENELKELANELKQMNATLTELKTLMNLITTNRLKKGDD